MLKMRRMNRFMRFDADPSAKSGSRVFPLGYIRDVQGHGGGMRALAGILRYTTLKTNCPVATTFDKKGLKINHYA